MRIFTKKRVFLGVLLLVVLVLIAPFFNVFEGIRCLTLRYLLLTALDQASSVQVIEHSDRFDGGFNPDYTEITYATVTLTPKQIADLRAALPFSMDFDGGILKCIFEEHHRIEIRRPDGTLTTIHLCFQCGQIYMNNQKCYGIMPPGWRSNLNGFITSLGLHPDRPWDKNPSASK